MCTNWSADENVSRVIFQNCLLSWKWFRSLVSNQNIYYGLTQSVKWSLCQSIFTTWAPLHHFGVWTQSILSSTFVSLVPYFIKLGNRGTLPVLYSFQPNSQKVKTTNFLVTMRNGWSGEGTEERLVVCLVSKSRTIKILSTLLSPIFPIGTSGGLSAFSS